LTREWEKKKKVLNEKETIDIWEEERTKNGERKVLFLIFHF